ncbi:RNA methyltransferase [Pullulanibacillus sp. KACC 23026]|uniref:TRM11 family SAM-dependent methyltransferase n=1 Tax=Pullulanibacillus sp. KACC 23026 TaxID=3028315 RepID=UPI0023B08F69|nr:RNA methyltransferase [Pullulanibacillus sp. KACC 23026]WEG14788.1 RNA methyltransferase [Pullulanibacillus sp. KACC 23026]
MRDHPVKPATYVYTFSCSEEERSLCKLEQRSLFGEDSSGAILTSSIKRDPSRSPFIKERLEVLIRAKTLGELMEELSALPALSSSFKVQLLNTNKRPYLEKIDYEERQRMEREIGQVIRGKADLNNPELLFGLLYDTKEWIFGSYLENKKQWLLHQRKPHHYSTALNTRVARAVVNIALPCPIGKTLIDPCCGMGTVLIEALSMGIAIEGSDRNPLVMKGARENIIHFGYSGQVLLRDMHDIQDHFDSAIIDMPYNLCSVISDDEKLRMMRSARRMTDRLVIITVEPLETLINQAGFQMIDRCEVSKSHFTRQILLCE